MISNTSKISGFAPPGAPPDAPMAHRVAQKLKFFNMEKKLFFVENNFLLAIYCSESFMNVDYG